MYVTFEVKLAVTRQATLPHCLYLLFFPLFEVLILKGRKINKIKNLIIFVSNLIQLGLKDGDGRGEEVDNPYLVSFSYYDICI